MSTSPEVANAPFGDEFVDQAALDEALHHLHERREFWASVDTTRRAALLDEVLACIDQIAPSWLAEACAVKGLDPTSPAAGEELLSGIGSLVRLVTSLRTSLQDIATHGRPRYPGPVRHHAGNRISVGVLPASLLDRVIFTGIAGEVWFQPGVTESQVREEQAWAYRGTAPCGLSLVLAAGNVASLGPKDALDKLFVEGHVVVMKSNPVNEYLVPYWERALAPLIAEGVLRIVRGGAATGSYLVEHPLVDDVHITGSDATYDAIAFGVGDERRRRKADDDPRLTKPISAELGNVSPVIVVPGQWSQKELAYQAAHVATMLTNNAGFNCLTPRVLVTHRGWAQREEFLRALEEVLDGVDARRAYYPGARQRWSTFMASHPEAAVIGSDEGEKLPWTVLRDVPSEDHTATAFTKEAFCSLMAETALDAPSTDAFIDRAVDFCNDVVWGTLSMTLLVDPRTAKEPAVETALTRAVENLRYGTVGVNVWHAMGFLGATTTWGAFPGHHRTDIQSGTGVVGNAYMFQHVEKTVLRGPFVAWPRPGWFCTNRHGYRLLQQLFRVQVTQRWRYVPALLATALRR